MTYVVEAKNAKSLNPETVYPPLKYLIDVEKKKMSPIMQLMYY